MDVNAALADVHQPLAALLVSTSSRGHAVIPTMAVEAPRRWDALVSNAEDAAEALVAEPHLGAPARGQGLATREAASTPLAGPTHTAHSLLMHRHAIVAHDDIYLAASATGAPSPRGATALLRAVETLCEASRQAPRAASAERLPCLAILHLRDSVLASLAQALPSSLCGTRLRDTVRCELASTRCTVAIATRLRHSRLASLLVATFLVLAWERSHY